MNDTLKIKGEKLTYKTIEGRVSKHSTSMLDQMLRSECSPFLALNGQALPDGVKFIQWKRPILILVHETPPLVRLIRWNGRKYNISLPYTIMFFPFYKTKKGLKLLWPQVEIYFRSQPLTSLNDKLGYPPLLNMGQGSISVSEKRRVIPTICMGDFDLPNGDWATQMHAYIDHFWGSGFNPTAGMENYERTVYIDERLFPIDNWQRETKKDKDFILSVKWEKTIFNVGKVIEDRIHMRKINISPREDKEQTMVGRFGNFILQAERRKK